jgi:hypothetical protein
MPCLPFAVVVWQKVKKIIETYDKRLVPTFVSERSLLHYLRLSEAQLNELQEYGDSPRPSRKKTISI